jgi:hypothetical protein
MLASDESAKSKWQVHEQILKLVPWSTPPI